MKNVKIVTYVPSSHADAVREALGSAGAGHIGEYSYCSFTSAGTGRYLPSSNAKPYIGQTGTYEQTPEERIEVVCDRKQARAVIAAMKQAHPYEEVAFDIYPLIDEDEL